MSGKTPSRGRPSPMMFISLGIGAAVAIALISVVSYFTGGTVTSTNQSVGRTITLPTFSVQDLEGQHVVAPWASGHPAVLVFFASWCAPCTKELPVISAYLHRHHLGATRVIGVNYLDDPQRARALAAASHFDFPVLADGGTITQGELALTGLPDTVVVNGRGVVTALTHGVVDARTLAADLATLR